jgi:hypothetical protein
MEMMKNQGKKMKETVMDLMNPVMEKTTLVIIMKNPVPMKIMMAVKINQEKMVELRGMIRRMVEKDDESNKDNEANGDGNDDESGKDGGTDESGKKDSSDEEETNDELDKENKANGEGDDGCGDGENGGDDNHDKKSGERRWI